MPMVLEREPGNKTYLLVHIWTYIHVKLPMLPIPSRHPMSGDPCGCALTQATRPIALISNCACIALHFYRRQEGTDGTSVFVSQPTAEEVHARITIGIGVEFVAGIQEALGWRGAVCVPRGARGSSDVQRQSENHHRRGVGIGRLVGAEAHKAAPGTEGCFSGLPQRVRDART